MSRRRMFTLAIISIALLHLVYATPFAALDCPTLVYINEVFTCRAKLYSLSDSTEIPYAITTGDKLVTSETEGTVSIQPGELWEKEINVWAVEGGSDMLAFEYGSSGERQAHVVNIRIVEPPLRVSVPTVQLLPGKMATAKIKLKGDATGVFIEFSYPPTLTGERIVDVGDVSGEKMIKIEVSADPFAIGSYPVDVYVTFFDKYGVHTLKLQMYAEVGIPPTAWFTLIAILLVLGAGYGLWKRKKKAKES